MKRLIFCAIALTALLGILHFASARERGLTYHEVQFVDETGAPVTVISSINIYKPDSTTDATIYMDPGLQKAITQSITTDSANTTFNQSEGALYWWGPDGYDFRFTNGTNTATNAGHRTRTSSEGRLWFPSYLADITSADYNDGESVTFGDDDDFTFNAGTTDDLLTITPTTNGTSKISMGTTGSCCDVNFFGDDANYDLMWDATDNRLEFSDNAILSVGTGIDWNITHNGTTTTMTGALTHASDEIFSGDATFNGTYDVEWDVTRNALHFLDNARLELGGTTGSDDDVYLIHDGTTLSLLSAAADEPFAIGGVTHGFDTTYYFETDSTIATDYDGKTRTFDGVDIIINDDDYIKFGDSSEVTILYDDTGSDDFKIDCTKTVAGDALILETTNGGILLHGDGSANGDIQLDTADDLTLTVADDMIVNVAGDLTETTTGTKTVSGVTDYQTTYYQFRSAPVVAGDAAGAAATGTDGDENRFITEDGCFEYHIIDVAAGVTVCYPIIGGTIAAGGYDIGMDETDNEGCEVGQGITARCKHSLVSQTDSGYLEVKLYITDVDGTDDCAVGWRKAAVYNKAIDSYSDFYALNVISGSVFIESNLNTTGTDSDDTSIDTADTTAITLKVVIADDGTVTSFVNGTEETEHQTEFTFDEGDVLIPFFYFLHASEVANETYLMEWKCQKD